MERVYINPLHELYKGELKEALESKLTVVCSHRPVNGKIQFEYENIGYGCYFAAGDINKYGKHWKDYDCKIVQIRDNKEVERIVMNELEAEGVEKEDILKDYTIAEVAEELGYMYID
jgi:hypothetical protein